ncbi:hypothetical protein PV327_010095 [Microctonus hyperodae]|uniref:Mutator-like transposase domain-containing protein n=1 Tax=Microctonus hyperodae TaxID=165561 RepID=A0AA39F2B9_MICHY|nr:hypothetical protein PV327_010095 [Microctonus hyperodae]
MNKLITKNYKISKVVHDKGKICKQKVIDKRSKAIAARSEKKISQKHKHLKDIYVGAVHAGVGCTSLNKIISCLNIPTISPKLFKKYEREVGPAIEEAAKESCKRSAEEERRSIVENVEKLCEELSEEISQKVYGDLIILKPTQKMMIGLSLSYDNRPILERRLREEFVIGPRLAGHQMLTSAQDCRLSIG